MAERERVREKRFRRKKRVCIFCAEKVVADYKNVDFLRKFMTDRGKIASRRSSGCCAKHQRFIMRAIKKARHLGLVPYMME